MNFFTKTLFCDIFMTMGFLCGEVFSGAEENKKSPEHKGEKGMNGTNGVSVSKVAQIMDLYNFLPDMDLKKHRIKISDVNRPALQLSGFFEHFEQSRVQIIGNVEYTYLQRLDVEKKEKILQKFTTYDIPCIIFCRDLQPDEDFLQIASENDVPVLGTRRSTSEFMAELIFCLSDSWHHVFPFTEFWSMSMVKDF